MENGLEFSDSVYSAIFNHINLSFTFSGIYFDGEEVGENTAVDSNAPEVKEGRTTPLRISISSSSLKEDNSSSLPNVDENGEDSSSQSYDDITEGEDEVECNTELSSQEVARYVKMKNISKHDLNNF